MYGPTCTPLGQPQTFLSLTPSSRQDPGGQGAAAVARWERYRTAIVEKGLGGSLAYAGAETAGKSIYAEFYGHVNGYGADSDRQRYELGDPAPLVMGMSWVQLAVVNNLLSHLSSAGGADRARSHCR